MQIGVVGMRLRLKYSLNPLIGFLSINSLQSKIDASKVITKNFPIDILYTDELKLDDRFLDHQFKIDGYQFSPFRRDRNKFDGRRIVYVKDVCKR